MQKGLTKKLDYEKAKLKSKATQPDYRDRLRDEGDNFDRDGSSETITLAEAWTREGFRKDICYEKTRALEFYASKLRGSLVRVGKWKFRFRFKPAEFAKENDISVQESVECLGNVQAEAQERLDMTLRSARRSTFDWHEQTNDRTGKTRFVRRLRFRTLLPIVGPVEWSRIYKRIELCPMEQETNA